MSSPAKINANRANAHLSTGPREIVNEPRRITADTALRLDRFFGTSADFWMNLQKTIEKRHGGAESWHNTVPRATDVPRAPDKEHHSSAADARAGNHQRHRTATVKERPISPMGPLQRPFI